VTGAENFRTGKTVAEKAVRLVRVRVRVRVGVRVTGYGLEVVLTPTLTLTPSRWGTWRRTPNP